MRGHAANRIVPWSGELVNTWQNGEKGKVALGWAWGWGQGVIKDRTGRRSDEQNTWQKGQKFAMQRLKRFNARGAGPSVYFQVVA